MSNNKVPVNLSISETIKSFNSDQIQSMTDEWSGVEPTGKKWDWFN